MRYFVIALIICISQFFFSNTFAQVKDKGVPFINHYSKKEYRGGAKIWDFAQADNNVLYVANRLGVLEFDGQDWDLIPMPNRSVVNCLFKDEDGKIYVGAYNEFGYLAPDSTGKISYHSMIQNIEGFEPGEIWRIKRQGDFFYFQSYNALVIFNKSLNSWDVEEPESTFGFLHLADDILYVNDRGKGIMKLRDGIFTRVNGGDFFADLEIWTIADVNGELLIATQNNGVFILKDGKVNPWNTEVNEFLLQNKFYSFEQTDDNLIWGSIQNGLVVTDNEGKIITHLNKTNGLNNNTVLSLHIDTEGNLWSGLDNGIDQIYIHSPLSYLITQNEIGAGYCAAIFEDRIYLGTNQGLFWIPAEEHIDYQYSIPFATPITECSGQVWSLTVIDDELLVGHNRGTFALKKNKVKHIYNQTGGWKFHTLPGEDKHIIQGTYNGLIVFRRTPEGLKFEFEIEGFESSSRIMHISDERTLWMGHGYEGIYKIELSSDLKTAVYVEFYGESSGLGTNNYNELFKVDGNILVGNSNGFYTYNEQIDDFEPAKYWNIEFSAGGRMTGLIPGIRDDYFFFQEKTSGHLQIFSDTLFVKNQGLLAPLNQSYIPSFENLSIVGDEELLIGTDGGFVHLDMELKTNKKYQIPFHFKRLQSLRENSQLNIFLNYVNDLGDKSPDHPLASIPYRENDIRISFVEPSLSVPEQNAYQYILDGRSGTWSPWSDKSEVDFTNLREGEYILTVRARNAFGQISPENKLYFHIETPWYRSTSAYITYFLLIILGIYLSWRVQNERIEREKRRSKLLEERRMLHNQLKLKRDSELAEKEIVKLRNDKLRARIRHKSKELANQTMGVLQKNRFLTEIKEEMILMKKKAQSDEVKHSLNKMLRKIDRNIEDENAQQVFETNFDQVHENFLLRLREAFPNLSAKDLRLCAYLRLNLSSKEIAPLLNISIRGVEISRYRLRKKLNLEHDEILADYILRF